MLGVLGWVLGVLCWVLGVLCWVLGVLCWLGARGAVLGTRCGWFTVSLRRGWTTPRLPCLCARPRCATPTASHAHALLTPRARMHAARAGAADGAVCRWQVAQFSYKRIPGADPLRGVEMASTGEAHTHSRTRAHARCPRTEPLAMAAAAKRLRCTIARARAGPSRIVRVGGLGRAGGVLRRRPVRRVLDVAQGDVGSGAAAGLARLARDACAREPPAAGSACAYAAHRRPRCGRGCIGATMHR